MYVLGSAYCCKRTLADAERHSSFDCIMRHRVIGDARCLPAVQAMRCSETNSLHLLRIDAPPTDPRDPPIARRLLEFLRERGLLDPAAVERAAKVQLETRQRIDVVIA